MINHLIFFFSFLLISTFSFAQLEIIDDSDDDQFELNTNVFENNNGQVIFRAFYLDKKGFNNDVIYNCLYGFNSQLFKFTIYNSVRTDINTREYIRKIKNSQSIDEINSLIKRWENKIKSSKELIITKDGKENERKILQQSTVYFLYQKR